MNELEPTDPTEEKVWELLKKAPSAEPGPFFARNILREVRSLEEEPSGFQAFRKKLSGWFTVPSAAFAGVAAAIAVFALVASLKTPSSPGTEPAFVNAEPAVSEEFDPASEIVSVEYFGDLMAVADPGQLDDAALGELFF